MGGLSCYTMCTSPKHAAPAAQALRRGSVLTNAHRRQETVHRLGSNSKVPRVRKLLLPPPLRVSGGDSLLDYPRGLLCDELCFLSRTAIGPPPNVTLVDWGTRSSRITPQILPRVHSDAYVTNTTGRRVVFASFKTNTREGIERIRRGRPLVPRSRRSAPREFHSLGVDSFLSWRFLPRNAHLKSNLVDSASSHTLVSKIKPCMSKYKRLYTVKLRTAH